PVPIVRPDDRAGRSGRSTGEHDLDLRPPSGRRPDVEPPAGALDPLSLRLQADVTGRDPLRQQPRVEATPVVADGELDRAVVLPELDPDVLGLRVLRRVRQQLAGGAAGQERTSVV